MAQGTAPRREGDGALTVRLRTVFARFGNSLFYTPALIVVIAIALARGLVFVDGRVGPESLPDLMLTTVENARTMLGAIVSATITSAVLLFTITLVAVQLSSSNFSPRTLPAFLRDRVQQVAIGFVTGTFAYSLVVLREVRVPRGEAGASTVPHIAVAVGVVLAIASLLAIIAGIDHTARSLRVESVVEKVMRETLGIVRRVLGDAVPMAAEAPGVTPARPALDAERGEESEAFPEPPDEVLVVTVGHTGWVQQVGIEALRRAIGEGSTVRVDVAVGTFVVEGTPLALLWPVPDDADETERRIRRAFAIGGERTMQQDIGYGFVRMVDVALRALSPGINDPNTADEVIVRLGAVLREILLRDLPSPIDRSEGRTVFLARELSHGEYVRMAFDQIRHAASDHPQVLATLIRTLGMLARETERHGVAERVHVLRDQADLAVEGLDAASFPDADRALVVAAAREAGFR